MIEFIQLCVVIVCAVVFSLFLKKLNLPELLGMLIVGMVAGPYALDFISPSIMDISGDLRLLALIVILFRAGLALDIGELKKAGKPAFHMAFIPPVAELAAVVVFAPMLFSISRLEAAIMGAVLCAVSPAIVVPRMLKRVNSDKYTAQIMLAATSVNGILAVALFSVFIGMEGSASGMVWRGVALPLAAVVAGAAAVKFFHGRKGIISKIAAKIWIPTEFVLFILVGAAVNVRYAAYAGFAAIVVIAVALAFRFGGVALCLLGTRLNAKERIFCAVAYLPKATVQAAIGGTALAVGIDAGGVILAVAVLAILITAPIGAVLIDMLGKSQKWQK